MQLSAQTRNILGKSVRKLRSQGLIPAELYGHGVANLHLSVSAKDFKKVFKSAGESTIIDVLVDGKTHKALIHDVVADYISDEIIHADLHEVRLDQKIKIKVPLEFIGEAPAIKLSGVLVKSVQELELEALPMDIPRFIKVDLSVLTEIGKSIHVKDLPIASNLKVMINPETVVASITEQMTEEQEAALSAAPKVEDIKVETEEKKAEREAKKVEEGKTEEKK